MTRWRRRKTWRQLWEKPVVMLADPQTDDARSAKAQALFDLFDLMENVRMQPGAHRFIFGPDCRLERIERHGGDQS